MSDQNIQKAIALLAEVLECPASSLTEDDTIETVKKWDSLNHMRLILQLEERYERQVDPDTALNLFTIKDLATYLS